MAGNDELTPGEIRRALNRIDARVNSIVAVSPEVFAAEIRTQQEIHNQHRQAIEKLTDALDVNKEDLENDVAALRTWLRWLFALLVTNLVTLLGLAITTI